MTTRRIWEAPVAAESPGAWIVARAAEGWNRPAHEHETGLLEMRDQPLGDYLCRDPAAWLLAKARRLSGQRKAGFDVAASGGR